MCVYDVCEIKVVEQVSRLVCNAEIKEANPHRKLLLDAFVLKGEVIIIHVWMLLLCNSVM